MLKKFEWVLVGLGAIMYLFVFPHGAHGDGFVRYQALEQLLTQGQISTEKYSLWGPLFAAPLYALGWIVKTPYWWVTRFNTFVFFAFLVWAYRFFRHSLGLDVARRLVLCLMAAGMFSKHVTDFYAEIFSACLAGIGMAEILWAKDGRPRLRWYFLLALAGANTPAIIPALGLVGAWLFLKERRVRDILFVVGPVLLIGLESWVKRGSPFDTGYAEDFRNLFPSMLPYSGVVGFGYPIGLGLLSIFFSYGKGLLFFAAPICLFAFFAHHVPAQVKRIAQVWLLFLLGLILLYSKWWAWQGGWYWGPRFFLFASLPASLILAVCLSRLPNGIFERLGVLIVGVLALWVSCTGIAFGQNNQEMCAREMEYLCLYVPDFAELWRPFIAEKGVRGRQLAFVIFHALVAIALLAPLVRSLAQDLYERVRALTAAALRWQEWRW